MGLYLLEIIILSFGWQKVDELQLLQVRERMPEYHYDIVNSST